MHASRRLHGKATLQLVPGRDYHVLRGQLFDRHEAESCSQCVRHSSSDPDWPKLHTIGRTLRGAPLEVYLAPTPEVFVLAQATRPPRRKDAGMGNLFGDLFDFIKSVIDAVLSFIGQLLSRIVHDLLHPMDLLKDLVQVVVDTVTGAAFLKLMKAFPLTHWIYQGLNWLTGGFMDNLTLTLSLPGMLLTGQTITRAMLLKALSVVIVAIGFAITLATGGMLLAVIGLSVSLLKQGPIGKTALGRTLLDIAGIGLGAVCGGSDIIAAFANAGMSKLQGTAVGALANRLHLSGMIVGLTTMGVGAAAGAVSSSDSSESDTSDGLDASTSDESDEPFDATEDTGAPEETEAPSSPEATSSDDSPASSEDAQADEDTETPESEDEASEENQDLDASAGGEDIDASAGGEDIPEGEGTPEGEDDSVDESGEDDSAPDEDDEDEEDEDSEEESDEMDPALLDALKAAQLIALTTQALTSPRSTSARPASSHPSSLPTSARSASARSQSGRSVKTASEIQAQQKSMLMVAGLGAIAVLALLKGR